MSIVSAYHYRLKDTGEIIAAMVYTGADTLSQVEKFSGLVPHDTYLLSNNMNDMCCMINSPRADGQPGFESVKLNPGNVLIKRANGTFESWPKALAEQHYSNLEVLDKWLIYS